MRNWITAPPFWVDIYPSPAGRRNDAPISGLDAGEEDAILLALELHADLVLMDDEDFRQSGFDFG